MRTRIGLATAVIAVVAGAQAASAGGFVNLPRSGIGFRTSQPAYRQWGTPRMINGLISLGKEWNYSHPGHYATYADISLQFGGYFYPHVSHRHGVDVDIQPMTTSASGGYTSVGWWNYSTAYTGQLVWWIYHTPWSVNVIFHNNSRIGGVTYWPGHYNHLHVRIN